MTETTRDILRRSLLAGYAKLKMQLSRRLGSADLASEALHETWMRLEKAGELAPVVNPNSYLFRAALNVATNLRVSEARHLSGGVEIDDCLLIEDDFPDPERVTAAHQDIEKLESALAELPARQQQVFREFFINGTDQIALARLHGVTVRTIQADIHTAIDHCSRRLGRRNRFASKPFKLSSQ